jgi:hypothetical protein
MECRFMVEAKSFSLGENRQVKDSFGGKKEKFRWFLFSRDSVL